MSENTKIQWATHTFNPWEGCTKVSDGCKFCYADARAQRFGTVKWGAGQPRRRTSAANWRLPVNWNRDEGAKMVSHTEFVTATRPRVFCASLADWLDDEVPIEWLADLLKLIHDTPNLDWLLLTKRPENFYDRVTDAGASVTGDLQDRLFGWADGEEHPANVWLGVSVEHQAVADLRIPQLLSLPARVRFLSVEPMLSAVNLPTFGGGGSGTTGGYAPGLHWAIYGGESGSHARPCNAEWIRSGLAQCREAGVAAFVKQLGSNPQLNEFPRPPLGDGGLRDKKGGDMAEWPSDLRVREFPL